MRNPKPTASAGPLTLGEALPELASWLRAALIEASRPEVAARIEEMPILSCWPGLVGNFNVGISRDEWLRIGQRKGRENIRLYQPEGVRPRRWQVGVTAVNGRPVMVGVSKPGILRPTLLTLSRKLAR